MMLLPMLFSWHLLANLLVQVIFILILTTFVYTHAKNTMLVSCANWRMYAGINYYVSSRVAGYGLATGHWLTTIMFPGWLLLTIIIFSGWLANANTNEEYWGEAR